MKVLHIGEYAQGGVATYIKSLLNPLHGYDVENYLICSFYNSDHKWNLPFQNITYYTYKRDIKGVICAIRNIRKYITELQPDVIYCHSTWAGFMARLPMLFWGKSCRVIYNAHGWAFMRDTSIIKKRIYAFIERCLLPVTDVVINVSQHEYKGAIQYGIAGNKSIIVYSGINKIIGKTDKNVQLPADKINLLFVGRFDEQKGVDILLHEYGLSNRDDIHLTLIGDVVLGDGNNFMQDNTENVTFLGWVPHEKLASYYLSCDAVVMPSRWEAFGLVAVEAMKYGKAVIASNKGALPEIVSDGVNGYVFDIEREGELASIINTLDKEELNHMGEKSKTIFKTKYDVDRMRKETYELY